MRIARISARLTVVLVTLVLSSPSWSAEIRDSKSGSGTSSGSDPSCQNNYFWCAPADSKNSACDSVLNMKQDNGFSTKNFELGECFKSLQSGLKGSLQDKKKAVLAIPSTRERAFLGYVMTCYGAAGAKAQTADMMAIMKVLDNRTDTCNRSDKQNANGKVYTPMEIALQEKQFSMYNADIYEKSKPGAFEAPVAGAQNGSNKIHDCIKAFGQYVSEKKSDWKPEAQCNKLACYYAPGGMVPAGKIPSWSKEGEKVPVIQVGDQTTTGGGNKFGTEPYSCMGLPKFDGSGK